jgi:hypothetical protein
VWCLLASFNAATSRTGFQQMSWGIGAWSPAPSVRSDLSRHGMKQRYYNMNCASSRSEL